MRTQKGNHDSNHRHSNASGSSRAQLLPHPRRHQPASLFTYPGIYAHQDGSSATAPIADQRARLLNVIAQCNHKLDPLGIHLSVLVWRPCGALVYAYRPHSLATYLADPRAKTALAKEGYDTDNLPICLARLASRIALASTNAAECACDQARCALDHQARCNNSCTCEFPHEIGYFLGYPYDDVHQFIVQHGENYKVFGAWKVYTNVEQALTTFDSYRACTQYLTYIYQQGCTLGQLVQATR
ncbi:DUF3793 family protein [Collinsella sp. OM07-12]|uniref:DUF3793 family protein n=1 Tax=Collinsella sp. OM07-12 TaxID=2292328 RepID=UPI000E44DC67|nr:DUF3793 family protein [Collinsella sp. OM07-12]RGM73147.1 DUF3793 family protein [Collinsella sp. OM07-12]